MKKYIYILLIAFSTTITITSCTEDEVAPKTQAEGVVGGGGETGKI